MLTANAGDAHHSGELQVTARQVSDLSLNDFMGIIRSIVQEEQHSTSNPTGSTADSTQATVSTTSSAPTSLQVVVSVFCHHCYHSLIHITTGVYLANRSFINPGTPSRYLSTHTAIVTGQVCTNEI